MIWGARQTAHQRWPVTDDRGGFNREGIVSEAALTLAKSLHAKADDLERLVYELAPSSEAHDVESPEHLLQDKQHSSTATPDRGRA
jgi:hypothetical protein